jgi:hypothetical protein
MRLTPKRTRASGLWLARCRNMGNHSTGFAVCRGVPAPGIKSTENWCDDVFHIDDASTGDFQQAFYGAANRFWRSHQSESFYVSGSTMGREWFGVSIRRFSDGESSPLVVEITDNPEEAILTALEKWWAEQQ